MLGAQSVGFRRSHSWHYYRWIVQCYCHRKGPEVGRETASEVETSHTSADPKAAAYVRNDGEVKWNLNDLDVATVEEVNPEGAMEVQNLRALRMGWVWYVNDLSKYLPDAEALADMTPADDVTAGISPEVPLSDIDLEPEVAPQKDVLDPYVADVPFPHASPGPAENELMGGDAPALLPRSQDVDLVVSEINIPMPSILTHRSEVNSSFCHPNCTIETSKAFASSSSSVR